MGETLKFLLKQLFLLFVAIILFISGFTFIGKILIVGGILFILDRFIFRKIPLIEEVSICLKIWFTYIVMCIVYLVILTPLALILRAFGKDFLDYSFRSRDSYWKRCEDLKSTHDEKRFLKMY